MNTALHRQAGEIIANEPVSVEPDGTVWVDSDGRVLDRALVAQEVVRLEQAATDKAAADAAARDAAIAHAKSLGFTDEMIAVMYPNLTPNVP